MIHGGGGREHRRNPVHLAAAILILSVCASGAFQPLHATETTYQVANQLRGWYDTKQLESLLDNRLDALVSHGPYTLGVSLLSHSPSDPARLDPARYGLAQQGIRKRWFEARAEKWSVRAGNVYGTFGRGLALQIYEDQAIDFDNPLDGVSGQAVLGPAEAQIIAGTNSYGPAQQVLKGGHVGVDLPLGFKTGVHGVWSDYLGAVGQGRTGGDRLYGGLLQKSLGGKLDAYGEYVVRDRRNGQGGALGTPQGHAGYANVNAYLGPLQLMGEFKDMLRYDLPKTTRDNRSEQVFVNVPPAVRAHATTLLNRATHVANIRPADEFGGLGEAYLSVNDKTRLTGSYSRSKARHSNQPAWEAYGELERWLGEHTELVLRADESEDTVLEVSDYVFTERITYGGTLVLPVTAAWSVDASYETQGVQESHSATYAFRFPNEFRDNVAILTLSRAPSMSWAATVEWTNDEREAKQSWFWAEWNLQLGERYQLLLGGGSLRGGQVCSGGVCKIVDPFEGGRIELLTTF